MEEYINSPQLLLNEQQEGSVKEYGLSDFTLSKKNNFHMVKYINYLPKSHKRQFLGLVYFSFYDLSLISKDFALDFSDVEGIEQYFIGSINKEVIIKNSKVVKPEKVLSLHEIEKIEIPSPEKKELETIKTYYSNLFISQDIILKNVGDPAPEAIMLPLQNPPIKKVPQARRRKVVPAKLDPWGEE
jgi:hypothetical protein